MSATKTPIEVGQYRADPGKKGRIVHIFNKAAGKYYADNNWLVKTVGAGGRTSTVSGFRLVYWPIVDASTITPDPKDTP